MYNGTPPCYESFNFFYAPLHKTYKEKLATKGQDYESKKIHKI